MVTPSKRLFLWDVLEEEYLAVHGALPPEYDAQRTDLEKEQPQPHEGAAWARYGQKRLELIRKQIHSNSTKDCRSALCLSGGGIRSATFNLGVLQALAKVGLLKEFHFLSTVSGGGFIGSWLTAWIKEEGRDTVLEKLQGNHPPPMGCEARPITWLRDYSNYLSPRMGLLSADTWTLAAIYGRNLLLNLLVFLPIITFALALPQVATSATIWFSNDQSTFSLGISLLFLGAACKIVAMTYMGLHWRQPLQKTDMQWDTQSHFLLLGALPMFVGMCFVTTGWISLHNRFACHHWRQGAIALVIIAMTFSATVVASVFVVALWHFRPQGHRIFPRLSTRLDRERDLGLGRPPVRASAGVRFRSTVLQKVAEMRWPCRRSLPASATAPGKCKWVWELIWLVLCAIIDGALLWGFAGMALVDPKYEPRGYACLAIPVFLLAFLVSASIYQALISGWCSDAAREWGARAGGWLMLIAACWAAVAAVVLFLPSLLLGLFHHHGIIGSIIASLGGVSGIATAILGKSSSTSGGPQADQSKTLAESAKAEISLQIAAAVFIVALGVALSLGLDGLIVLSKRVVQTLWDGQPAFYAAWNIMPSWHSWHDVHSKTVLSGQWWYPLGWAAILLLVGLAMGWAVNINWFSLHSVYRNRLVRAYLGASYQDRKGSPYFSPFTGFNPPEDVALCEFKQQKLRIDENGSPIVAVDGDYRLFQVLNMTLNLVAGDDLAWQQRKAESFTASCLHAGCAQLNVGYRSADHYGGGYDPDGTPQRKLSLRLGSAMAISGAAASPNMGYISSPTLAFLMTLLNVRLGVWLGNPASDETYKLRYPKNAAFPLVAEAFGQTNDTYKYINLSDGGHFENLGLYEMILRRCRAIVVCDVGADEAYDFQDLGNAVRKIHIDTGVRVDFIKKIAIHGPSSSEKSGEYFAVARIRYAQVDDPKGKDSSIKDGWLLYLKPALYGNEPADVCNYARQNSDFPQESTADQFFTESQFESYRALGEFIVRGLAGSASTSAGVCKWIERLAQSLG